MFSKYLLALLTLTGSVASAEYASVSECHNVSSIPRSSDRLLDAHRIRWQSICRESRAADASRKRQADHRAAQARKKAAEESSENDVQSPGDRCAPADQFKNFARAKMLTVKNCRTTADLVKREFHDHCDSGLTPEFETFLKRLKFYPDTHIDFDSTLSIGEGKTTGEFPLKWNRGEPNCFLTTEKEMQTPTRLTHPKTVDQDKAVKFGVRNAFKNVPHTIYIPLTSDEGYYIRCTTGRGEGTLEQLMGAFKRLGLNPKYSCQPMKETRDVAPAAPGATGLL